MSILIRYILKIILCSKSHAIRVYNSVYMYTGLYDFVYTPIGWLGREGVPPTNENTPRSQFRLGGVAFYSGVDVGVS